MEVKEYKSFEEMAAAIKKDEAFTEKRTAYQTYFATFGGGKAFAKHYVGIIAASFDAAHAAMFETFGEKWAFLYASDTPGECLSHQVAEYNIKPLCFLKAKDTEGLQIIKTTEKEFCVVRDIARNALKKK